MIRLIRITTCCTAVLAIVCIAAPKAVGQPSDLVAKFESRSHSFGSLTLPYRLFVPESYDSTLAYPLVVTFHGAGERGSNNTSQISGHRLATAWADTRVQSLYSPFVVSPQAPSGGRWEDVIISASGTAPIRNEMAAVLDLLDSLATEFSIDPDRVYATGLSLGGYGTFDAVFRAPTRFAGALAMSGGYSPLHAPPMKDVPLWIVHGESDTVVPPRLSKQMVTAFEELGNRALYVNCGHFGCAALTNPQLDAALAARPSLVYSGFPGIGHGPWAPWYDDPRMQDWLMTQHRLTAGAVTFTNPANPARISGTVSIEWNSAFADDSAEVWFSADGASNWVRVGERILNTGSAQFESAQFPDTPFGRLQVILFGSDGLAFAREKSAVLRIDNPVESEPVVELQDFVFRSGQPIVSDVLTLFYRAGDADSALVSATLQYSTDGGAEFGDIVSLGDVESGEQQIQLDLPTLPNASRAAFRLVVTGGTTSVAATSPVFAKETPRPAFSTFVSHGTGSGSANVTLVWIDAEALTGHTYRIDVQTPDGMPKTYTVTDLDSAEEALAETPIGEAEGPLFHGLRLRIADVDKAEVDRDRTGWVVGTPSLAASVRSPRVTLGGESIQLSAAPADYRLTITDAVADTTSNLFGFEAQPIQFIVENSTSGGRRKVLFDDKNGDGLPTSLEAIYILEPDSAGADAPSWMVTFVNEFPLVALKPGDVFELTTIKPLTSADTFTFVGAIGVGKDAALVGDELFGLGQNYPNPFSGRTTIPFTLAAPTHVVIEVFDVVGRRVARVFDGVAGSGQSAVSFTKTTLGSGTYFCRMQTEFGSTTTAMTIVD